MDNIVGKIKEALKKEKTAIDPTPLLSKENYTALPYSTEHFKKIQTASLQDSSKKVAFIDGGSAILLDSSDFCLGFIRTHAVTFKGANRASAITTEAYVFVSSAGDGKDISFKTEIIPIKGSFSYEHLLAFDSLDETIRLGIRRSSPSAMVGIARRFAELSLAKESSKKLGTDDLIVLDGSLQQSYTNEEELLGPLRKLSATLAAPTVIGFCKTNSLFTKEGQSFSAIISTHEGTWIHSPVATPTNNSPHISFARLHEKSPHVFMLESFSPIDANHLSLLAAYAQDPVFLGYPYGLIEADRAARISLQESSSLQFQLQERLGQSVRASLASKNAHSILDRISF